MEFNAFVKEKIVCLKCKTEFDEAFDTDKIWYINSCLHPFCRACLNKQIQTKYVSSEGNIQCLECRKDMQPFEIEVAGGDYYVQEIIGKEKKEQLEQGLIEKQFNIVTCAKCKTKFGFEKGNNQGLSLKDPHSGQQLSRELQRHYEENRFTCLNNACKLEQCRNCQAAPYHLGLTCEQFSIKKASKRCRYCDDTIHQVNQNYPPALQDICSQQECIDKMKYACKKVLPCGHSCSGFIGEPECLPCLKEDCAKRLKLDQDENDYCNICFTEGLGAAPCIRNECNHVTPASLIS